MAMLMAPGTIKAQNFDDYFTDKTLRVDYTFAGSQKQQMIAVDELNVMPRWYGKRHRLAELPVEGNGQITVRDHRSGKIIYRNSFSTLFQEWLSYPEAAERYSRHHPRPAQQPPRDNHHAHPPGSAERHSDSSERQQAYTIRHPAAGCRHHPMHPHRIRG